MTPELLLVVVGFFVSIALLAGLGASVVLGRTAPERRRLNEMAAASASGAGFGASEQIRLTEQLDPRLERIAKRLPKSPKEMSRLRRRLATAGIHSFGAAVFYSISELTLPFVFAALPLMYMTPPIAWLAAAVLAMIGYMVPGLVLGYLISKHKLKIENGLPDALDLMIVCVEAGTGLDQAIQKTSIELEISHPELASELRLITTEIRAGKTRIEAFKNFAERTKVDDVRSLVAMLVQTDRFGTSIAAALRTHAETSRVKRRQRAEERAAKIGVKLVFPLVFFLFPAFYVVTLGPAVIQFIRVFFGQVAPQ
jgi:tight adherence protein C